MSLFPVIRGKPALLHKFYWLMKYTVCLILLWASLVSAVQAPAEISYQGYLTDGGGTPINTSTDLIIKLFDAASGGTQVWTRTFNATPVADGVYSLILKNGMPNLGDVAFDKPLWLQW